MNKYSINDFLGKKKNVDLVKELYSNEIKIFNQKIINIIKELKITNYNNNNKNIWRHKSVLSKSLKDKDKELLELNSDINKITEKNVKIVYDKINKILINNKSKTDTLINYIIENLFEKCILQNIFASLYICFLSKLMNEKKNNINKIIKIYFNNILENLTTIIINIENIENYDLTKNKFSLLIKNNIENNKNYQSIGNIYSLLYLYDFIKTDNYLNLLFKYIKLIEEFVNWENFCKKKLEQIINILIGLLEYGYYKLIKNINNDSKLDLKLKIENLIKTKKISMRIKFNLQNIYESLVSGEIKIKKITF